MNEMNNLVSIMFDNFINQAIINREKQWQQLPEDQQEALSKFRF